MKFDFDDILITPGTISSINSRSEVNPFDINGMLPCMTAPMDTVVNNNNVEEFLENKLNVVLPRSSKVEIIYNNYLKWYSFGIQEFEDKYLKFSYPFASSKLYVLLDIANGNMEKLFEIVKKAKEKYKDKLVLMVGNIANPKTFEEWCRVGVDYVRCGIGNGNGCLTSQQTGIGYPMASLIQECYEIKKQNGYETKIVADGGFKKYSDIIKALALGADYVMLGSILNKCYESAGKIYSTGSVGDYVEWTKESYDEFLFSYHQIKIKNGFKSFFYENSKCLNDYLSLSLEEQKRYIIKDTTLYKKFRGMSTKEVQKDWNREELKTSEGISTYNKIEYTLQGFTENLTDYLKTAMSYTNSKTLKEFKESTFELITENALNRFKK